MICCIFVCLFVCLVGCLVGLVGWTAGWFVWDTDPRQIGLRDLLAEGWGAGEEAPI